MSNDDDDMSRYVARRIDPGLTFPTAEPAEHPKSNPFNPGFGVRPPMFAGRQGLVAEILARLNRGPGRFEYHTIVTGGRGTGKTLVLHEVGRRVREDNRWLTIEWLADEEARLAPAVARQAAAVETALDGVVRRGLRRLQGSELSLKAAPGGIGAEARVAGRAPAADPTSAFAMLERLAHAAATRHRTIVVLVDELQAATPADIRELSSVMQELANVRELPIAVVAVGLPTSAATLRASKTSKGFIERLVPIKIGNLDGDATRDALEIPFTDAGRTIDAEALDVLADRARGYPYAVQWAGYHAWEQAGDSPIVTTTHARRAARLMEQSVEATIYASRWQEIAPADRRYLYVAAQLADTSESASTVDIAATLGKTTNDVSRNRDRLINKHHVLQAGDVARVEFTVPGLAAWVLRHNDGPEHDAAHPAVAHPPTTRRPGGGRGID